MTDKVTKMKSRGGAGGSLPLHRVIYKKLLEEIQGETYRVGDRLPSEALLCARFGASRITVAKAIQSLQREGLVSRRAGSGTYVEAPATPASLKFGLLIPELGSTEIFEPICKGMMSGSISRSHTLVWGNTAVEADVSAAAVELCQQFITQQVDGIFFAPLEFAPTRNGTNERVVAAIERSRIPLVLLDRTIKKFPERSSFDLAGIDNYRAGFVLTQHLLAHGRKRILFASKPESAATVEARIAGYRLALLTADQECSQPINGDFSDAAEMQTLLAERRPDAIVCANDRTAARLMRTLLSLGVRIPDDVGIVGVDNVHYASLLPVPLTTIEQNCTEIGAAAMSLMLDRVDHRDRPARDLLIDFRLIVRESCGAHQLSTHGAGAMKRIAPEEPPIT